MVTYNQFRTFIDVSIRQTCLTYFDPLKPHFYIVKLGFTGVSIIFSYFCSKHRLWVLVRTASPRRGGSNEYPQSKCFIGIFSVFGGEIFYSFE